MARPKGHPKTGGRKKGSTNKATAEVKALAREYTPDAMDALRDIVRQRENLPAAVAAAKEILDRGWGKSVQPVSGPETDGPVRLEVTWLPPQAPPAA